MDKVREINRRAGLASASKRLLSAKTTDAERPSNDCSTDAERPSNDCKTKRREEKRREEIRREKNIITAMTSHCLNGLIKINWDAFLEIRKKKKAPNTDHALRLLIRELKGCGRAAKNQTRL